MKKVKKQKGITLVVLIITIIVLLILAVVAIRAVQGDGIIAHAKNAREQYEQKAAEENALLSNLAGYITGQVGGQAPSGPALSEIKIGDKVAYDEGYRADKKSDIDTNFQMDDMEWRVLDIEANGTVKLISTKPTTSTFTLSGEEGWLNGPAKLDKLCSDLYANGTGVTARSLKVEDVDKLANMITPEAKKTTDNNYGTKWRYQYDVTAGKIQYSKSEDNGVNWSTYVNTSNSKFKEPGKGEINSTNNTAIAELDYNYYYYDMASKITEKTSDNILVVDLIYKGLNEDNSKANNAGIAQWLASNFVRCDANHAPFYAGRVWETGYMNLVRLWESNGVSKSETYTVRPVVLLSSSVFTTKVDGTWQINI